MSFPNNLNIKIEKWVPNDDLFDSYQKYKVNIKSLAGHKLYLSRKIKDKEDLTNKINKLSTLNNTQSLFDISKYKITLNEIEEDISETYNLIRKIELTEKSSIENDWYEYIKLAFDFLQIHKLDKLIFINNILNSKRLTLMFKNHVEKFIERKYYHFIYGSYGVIKKNLDDSDLDIFVKIYIFFNNKKINILYNKYKTFYIDGVNNSKSDSDIYYKCDEDDLKYNNLNHYEQLIKNYKFIEQHNKFLSNITHSNIYESDEKKIEI
jgi:hypothetical protein